jgi:2-amino-4-hydroxy-6-hydroxymethyldihydropteridine diphosphokinase
MATAYLSFGSNLGDRLLNFKQAKAQLESFGIEFVCESKLYEAEPFCYCEEDKDQPWFLNRVFEVSTVHSPLALFLLCKEVESRIGSDTSSVLENGTRRYFPRLIDLDLLLYGREVVETELLQVPHPRFHNRRYDLIPLAELVPELVCPLLDKTVSELLEVCEDTCAVRLYEPVLMN